jgi:cytochrome c oxidase subunit 4
MNPHQVASENYPKVAHDAPHGVGHVVSLKILVNVFLALTLLTIVTVGASYVNFGEFNLIIALAIAVVKASLVVLFFMHLRWDKPFNSIVFVGCLIFVGLFISLALLDTGQYHGSVLTKEALKDPNDSSKTRVLIGNEPTEAPAAAAPGK